MPTPDRVVGDVPSAGDRALRCCRWAGTGGRGASDRPWPRHPSGSRARQLWQRVVDAASWTPPTSTEIGVIAKSGLAAGLSWWIAGLVTGVPDPVLAPLTAIVVVQVSVRSSVRTAFQRSVAVVLGVLLALAIGDALEWNGFTVAVLVAVSLGVAQLVLRLPAAAARQVPISGLVVLTAASSSAESSAWRRALDTLIGAAVGIVVSLVLPASRVVDARQGLERLADNLGGVARDDGCRTPAALVHGPDRGVAADRREPLVSSWSARPPKRSGAAGRPLSGTSAIDVTSTCSVATRSSCRDSSGQPSVSR